MPDPIAPLSSDARRRRLARFERTARPRPDHPRDNDVRAKGSPLRRALFFGLRAKGIKTCEAYIQHKAGLDEQRCEGQVRSALAAGAAASLAAAAGGALADPALAAQPAPLGVFGADMPPAGKLVFSVLPSYTRMQDSLIGSDTVSAAYIVSNTPSPRTPIGEHLLRMVPENAKVQSEGFAVAYGVSSDVTLTATTSLIQKDVKMLAFKGLAGVTPLGFSHGRTEGLGDTTIAGVVRLWHDPTSRLNFNLGLSLPTGATNDTMSLLLPNNTAPAKRGFYAMQPGAGTVDALGGVVFARTVKSWSWGASYRARLPLDQTTTGWRYGDLYEVNAWGGYAVIPGVEATLRLNATDQGAIQGYDQAITGYAQDANPAFYGGRQASLFGGVIVGGRTFGLPASQIGLEAGVPVYQHLNGPQLGRDWQVNLALRYRL